MAALPIVFSSFGGTATVGAVQTSYPLTPGVDVVHDTAANVGGLAASDGLVAGEHVKAGTVSVSVAATGVATTAVSFAAAFATGCDAVFLTLEGLGGAVINGGPYVSSVSATGFSANLDVTTAGTGSVTIYYVAFGH